MRGEAAQKAPCPAQADSCQSGQSFLSSRPQGFPTLSMLVPNCCGGYQGNHFLFLRSPHGKVRKGSGMVCPGVILKGRPSGLCRRPWPEDGSRCDAPGWGLEFRPASLSVEWEEAAKDKERGDLGVGALIHSSVHFSKHRICWALCWVVESQLRTGQGHPSLVGRWTN